jgi:hypothetical protein
MRDLGLGFLLFCSIVYLSAALRGLFPATQELALVGSLLVLIVLVSLRAVIQLRIAPGRLSHAGAIFLFLSFLTWEAPVDGFLIVVLSLLFLGLSMGCYLGCSLRELGQRATPISDRRFLHPIVSALVALAALTAVFLLMRSLFGWFLAMRWMLLVPAVLVVYELRHKGLAKQGEPLLIRPHLKQDWLLMAAYGLLLAGAVLLLLNLVASYVLWLQGQHAFQVLLAVLFMVSIFALKAVNKRYRHYFLLGATILWMVASVMLYADKNPMNSMWLLLAVLTGIAAGATSLSMKRSCANRDSVGSMRLLYVAVIIALLVVAIYPLAKFLLGPNAAFLVSPAALFVSLLTSFFLPYERGQ